ncbi:MAG: metallophosphoesterase family protein [Smithellaceae bacterium]
MEMKKVKIGVISDTHLSGYDERLKKIVNEHFGDVDIIIHAGDLVDLRVLEIFAGKEVKAVCGNMDYPSVKEKLPDRLLFEIKGLKFGVVHGWGAPDGIEERILAKTGNLDCIVYGHTHKPACHKNDGVLFFNPGSPTDKRFAAYRSIGILEIDKGIAGRIINF